MRKREQLMQALDCLAHGGKGDCERLECQYGFCGFAPCNVAEIAGDALEVLKGQENREQAICKEICDFIRHACSTDTDDDKDYVCYVIQNCFKHFCADGERRTDDA